MVAWPHIPVGRRVSKEFSFKRCWRFFTLIKRRRMNTSSGQKEGVGGQQMVTTRAKSITLHNSIVLN